MTAREPKVETVNNRADLQRFVEGLLASWKRHEQDTLEELSPEDLSNFGVSWNAITIRQFLEGILASLQASEGRGGEPTWREVAQIIDAGRTHNAALNAPRSIR